MHIITKIVQLLGPDLPVIPSGPGTFLIVDARQNLSFGIGGGVKSTDSESVTVDWGDGERQTLTENLSKLEHVYAKPGYYLVSVSDDLMTFGVGLSSDETFTLKYAPMVLEALSRGKLDRFRSSSFMGAVNLTRVDMTGTTAGSVLAKTFSGCTNLASLSGLPPTIERLSSSCFSNCSSLRGRVDFPSVASILANSEDARPFFGCDGITEIHFAAANEAYIKDTLAWSVDPKLGAANATIFFDL